MTSRKKLSNGTHEIWRSPDKMNILEIMGLSDKISSASLLFCFSNNQQQYNRAILYLTLFISICAGEKSDEISNFVSNKIKTGNDGISMTNQKYNGFEVTQYYTKNLGIWILKFTYE